MGCNHSKQRSGYPEDMRPVKIARKIIRHEDTRFKLEEESMTFGENISINKSKDVEEDKSEETNFYEEVSTSSIHFKMPIDDDKTIIDSYIKTAVEFRNKGSGVCNLETQLQKQRPEMICVGAFIQANNNTNKYEIVSYDTKLPNSSLKYRPDLILRENDSKVIVHVELDEFNHRSYNKMEEKLRMDQINQYFAKDKYMVIHFNPSIYVDKVEMATKFVQLINSIDALTSASYRNEIVKE